jgi:hypothetical protein
VYEGLNESEEFQEIAPLEITPRYRRHNHKGVQKYQ